MELYDRTIRETFAKNAAAVGATQFYVESMEDSRIPQEDYENELLILLQQKYKGTKFDCIFAFGPPALEFLLKNEAALFPGTPRVFSLIDERQLEGVVLGSNTTGVSGRIEFNPTVELILAQNPKTKKIAVVGGSSPFDKELLARAQKENLQYTGRVEFQYLSDLTIDELKIQLASMPPDTVIYFITFLRDRQGNTFSTRSALTYVLPTASVPIYGISEGSIGAGIVGGNLVSFESIGKTSADIALRLIAGERPRDIPPILVPSVTMFDARELERWKIDSGSIPADSVVRFRELSLWEQYRAYILAVSAVLVTQTILIVALLVSQSRRRRAELERIRFQSIAAQEHARLDEVVSNVPGIVWESRVVDGGRKVQFVSGYVEKMLGYSVDECLADPKFLTSRVVEEDRERYRAEATQVFTSGEQAVVQFRCVTKDGAWKWAETHVVPILDESGKRVGLRGVTMDITDRKAGEEKLRSALDQISELKDQLQEENIHLKEVIKLEHDFPEIIGSSDELEYILFKIEEVAPTDSTVLITGETGTGKELVARAIHSTSHRKNRPLVRVNCAALSASLIESELFGHEKGSFTGAAARKIGRFELADGGTIFLDEVGELPIDLQVKLLRVLQEGEFERLGSSKTINVDARIIAATNRDLELEVKNGRFRSDLWFRLNVFPITVPPLRERKVDIPVLVEHFVARFAKKLGKTIRSVSPASLRTLTEHSWPGNIRELANVIERSVINTKGETLRISETFNGSKLDGNGASGTIDTLETVERKYILHILEQVRWRIHGDGGAANILGLNPSTLRSRMAKLQIAKNSSSTPVEPNNKI